MWAGWRSVVAVALSLLALVGAAACGGGSAPRPADPGDTAPSNGSGTGTQSVPSDLQVPKDVPRRATGPAHRSSTRVIRRWLAALDRGDVRRAAHYFALPSKFQNATPVLTVNTERERIAVNMSLSCGAVATKMGGAGAFTIVTFKLTQRPGGDCGTGVGGTARGAIRVERRMIKEWYRLPDEPDGQQAAS
jgi:hypothetical protein